jgi:uncharacterized membrane protein YqjE
MDLATKEQFKWKFYRLVLMLNVIILLIAIGIIALFKAPGAYRIPVFLLLVLSALGFTIYFWSQYRSTHAWLQKQE